MTMPHHTLRRRWRELLELLEAVSYPPESYNRLRALNGCTQAKDEHDGS